MPPRFCYLLAHFRACRALQTDADLMGSFEPLRSSRARQSRCARPSPATRQQSDQPEDSRLVLLGDFLPLAQCKLRYGPLQTSGRVRGSTLVGCVWASLAWERMRATVFRINSKKVRPALPMSIDVLQSTSRANATA